MYNLSRQAKIDKVMCKPGYTWNETLQRCLPAASYSDMKPDKPKTPDTPKPPADQAIDKEKAKRAAAPAKAPAAPPMKPVK